MRIVLDTNVLISGTFWTGDSYKILQLIDAEKIKLVISIPILREYDRILHSEEILDKQAYQYERILAVQKIIQKAIIVKPSQRIEAVKDDPYDDKFLETALEGQTYFLITNDKHLLKLKQFRNIRIITPREFIRQHDENGPEQPPSDSQ